MALWVGLLRGVNLGARRKVPMAPLRNALTAAGLTRVRTLQQSGNIVAESAHDSAEQFASLVREVLQSEFALDDVPVIVRSPGDLNQVIAGNPFAIEAEQRANLIRVIFLAEAPAPTAVARLLAVGALTETCRVAGRHVYVDYVHGYHNTHRTAPYFTRMLGVDGTERNWRTVLALAALCAGNP
jgi:uncharacterized protein (DUF1697 family)